MHHRTTPCPISPATISPMRRAQALPPSKHRHRNQSYRKQQQEQQQEYSAASMVDGVSPLLPRAAPPSSSTHQHAHTAPPSRPLTPSHPHHRRSSSRASNSGTIRPSSSSSTSFLVVDGEKAPSKRQRAETWERVSMKLQAGAWVVGTLAMLHYTDFVHVLLNDERIYRGYFHIAMMCIGINLCIGAYLTVYLPFIKGVDLEWAIYCPRMIPAATLTGVVCAFTLVSALWPVYGFFAPLILLILCMGALFALHFIPWPF